MLSYIFFKFQTLTQDTNIFLSIYLVRLVASEEHPQQRLEVPNEEVSHIADNIGEYRVSHCENLYSY